MIDINEIICPICGHELLINDTLNNRTITCSNTKNCNFSCSAPKAQKNVGQTSLTDFMTKYPIISNV